MLTAIRRIVMSPAVLGLVVFLCCSADVAKAALWRTVYMNTAQVGPLSGLPYGKYTHFIMLDMVCNNGRLGPGPWYAPGDFATLVNSAHGAGTKVIVGLGLGTDYTSCTTSTTIDSFVTQIKNFISGKDPALNPSNTVFDGIDLDWEAGVSGKSAQYISFIQKLRTALGPSTTGFGPNTISIAVYGAPNFLEIISATHQHVDQVNLMTYDLANTYNDSGQLISWFNTPLHSPTDDIYHYPLSIVSVVKYFVNQGGVPVSKLGIGLSSYSYLFNGCTQPEVVGCAIAGTVHNHDLMTDPRYGYPGTLRYHTAYGANYLSITSSNQFIGIVDVDEIKAVVDWAKNNNVGGIMQFAMDGEYMAGASGVDARFPFSSALHNAVTGGTASGTAPVVTTASQLPGGTVNIPYSQTLAATGATPMTWSVASGSLPSGLSLSQAGVISGTPSGVAASNFTVRAANSSGTGDKALSLTTQADPYTYWKFDDATGATAADSSGNRNTASLYNNPSWLTGTSCRIGACLSFNGSNQHASAAVDISGTQAVTVSFWMSWSSYANDDRLALEFTPNFNSSTVGFMVDPNSSSAGGGQFEVGLQGDAGYNQVVFARPSAGTWHHYAFVFNKAAAAANEVTPYVDGTAVPYTKTSSADNTNGFGADRLHLMSRATSSLFGPGVLDDMRIHRRALSASEIQLLAAGAGTPVVIAPSITTANPLPSGVAGTAYSQTLAANGTTPITWSVTAGSLPGGVTLNSSAGVISGTPTSSGTFNFTLQAANTAGAAAAQFSLTINPAAPATPPPADASLTVSIVNPAAGRTVSGVVPITVATTSAASVQYRLDGVPFATVNLAPFTYNWNTRSIGNRGWHQLDAVATGAAGNTVTSQPVLIRIR
ncbi:MAG TPA: glycosyl hydrolase family 18 protein [Bryobacteraceae bacterium]|nr:glycosyl hydrolase family 18 protein [Bryobacteraceae bacterium]